MNNTGLIGEKLGHSLSPQIHQRFYHITNIQGNYQLFETPKNDLGALLTRLEVKGYSGLNVTIPYKTEVMGYLDEISKEATAIGAVNTIRLENGKRYGHNTDYFGLKTLLEYNNIAVKDKRVVILGSGGAARCAFRLVLDEGAKEGIVISRNPNSADKAFVTAGYDTLSSLNAIDVLINTTPVGMSPHENACPVEDSVIQKSNSVVDLIYNPQETVLLKKAKACGKITANGLLMLTAQAIKAQEIWNNQTYSQSIYQDVFSFIQNSLHPKKTNVVLIGMPGCGKTSIGKRLAEQLDMYFTDTDALIIQKHGSITDIFSNQGEPIFRQYEHQATAEVATLSDTVISTGGGIILDERNMQTLKKTGIVVFVDRPLVKLLSDIDTSSRPLLAQGKHKLSSLYDARYPLYQKYADITADNATDMDACIADIMKKLEEI